MNTKFWLNIPDRIVETFARFIWTGSMEDSDIWFIGNEERFPENEWPIDKYNAYGLWDSDPGHYFPLSFDLCHSLSDSDPVWDKLEYVSSLLKNKLFLWETFFLPASSWGNLWETYWLKSWTKRGWVYKWDLRIELDNRTKYYFDELEKNHKGKKVIFYWNDAFKLDLLGHYLSGKEIVWGKKFDQIKYPIKQTEVYEFNYFENRVFIAPFVYDPGFLKLKWII